MMMIYPKYQVPLLLLVGVKVNLSVKFQHFRLLKDMDMDMDNGHVLCDNISIPQHKDKKL